MVASEKKHRIKIDKTIDFSYVLEKFSDLYSIEEPIEIEFNRVFVQPGGIALLSTLINYKNETSNSIKIIYHDDDIKYLSRADFFKNLNYDIEESFTRHSVDKNMMECKKVLQDGDPDFIDSRLKTILKAHISGKENLILGILLTTYEVTDNILEHCAGEEFKIKDRTLTMPGFVSAQYYGGSKNQIEIGISDAGIGIINSLEPAYPHLSREKILENAFKLNTSRHWAIMPNRGNGLAKLKEFVLSSNGSIQCLTNEFLIVFNNIYPNGYIEKINPIIGTHFNIIIGCQHDIDTKPIFNATHDDYEDSDLDNFFDF